MKSNAWALLLFFTSSLCAQTATSPHPLIPVDPARLPPASATISKNQLLVPPKALRELQRSQTAFRSGDIRSSTQHLEKALRIYPNYLEAHNNLGAQYIELHEYQKAAAELQRAIQMDPRAVQPLSNLSVAFFHLQRYPDAEAAARQALDIDPHHSISRYVLGCILATENRGAAEAMDLLKGSKNEFPDARLLLAGILVRRGDVDEARKELQEYLALPASENRADAERWLAQLTKKQGASNNPSPADQP
jgi:tetratricopeptide (TPR) repeat protein